MKLPHRWGGKSGFTLIEMLIVLAIATLLGGVGISFGVSTMSRSLCSVESDRVLAALFHVRNQAVMTGTHVVAHLESDRFVVTPSGAGFLPFAGANNPETAISITGPACERSITINNVGAIIW